MKIVWFRSAIADLEEARAYIARDDPKAARRVASAIVPVARPFLTGGGAAPKHDEGNAGGYWATPKGSTPVWLSHITTIAPPPSETSLNRIVIWSIEYSVVSTVIGARATSWSAL